MSPDCGPPGNRTRISCLQGERVSHYHQQPIVTSIGVEPMLPALQAGALPTELRGRRQEYLYLILSEIRESFHAPLLSGHEGTAVVHVLAPKKCSREVERSVIETEIPACHAGVIATFTIAPLIRWMIEVSPIREENTYTPILQVFPLILPLMCHSMAIGTENNQILICIRTAICLSLNVMKIKRCSIPTTSHACYSCSLDQFSDGSRR